MRMREIYNRYVLIESHHKCNRCGEKTYSEPFDDTDGSFCKCGYWSDAFMTCYDIMDEEEILESSCEYKKIIVSKLIIKI